MLGSLRCQYLSRGPRSVKRTVEISWRGRDEAEMQSQESVWTEHEEEYKERSKQAMVAQAILQEGRVR